MNQIMINAAEWLAMQDRLDTLKRENGATEKESDRRQRTD
jgi:hypothetical protein